MNSYKDIIKNPDFRLNSSQEKERDQIAYWNDVVCNEFINLDCDLDKDAHFFGEIRAKEISDIRFSEIHSSPQAIHYRKNRLASSTEYPIAANLQVIGSNTLCQNGNTTVQQPGDIVFFDSSIPFSSHTCNNFAQLVVQIPRHAFLHENHLTNESQLYDLSGLKIQGNTFRGKMFSNFLLSSLDYAGRQVINRHDQTFISQQICNMLMSALTDIPEDEAFSNLRSSELSIEEIEHFVNENIHQPLLSATYIASAFAVSSRSIYKIFERHGSSLAKLILQKRLNLLASKLAACYQNENITEIIYSCGFSNLSHASTTFKKYYEMSPSSFRQKYR